MPLIRVPFADSGDKTAVPVASQSDGSVSYVQGYPLAYSLDPETDTGAKRIERLKMNQLFNDITTAIREMQVNGVKPFITSDENGGSSFTYAAGALVKQGAVTYQSLVDNNTQTPPGANWTALANVKYSLQLVQEVYTGNLNTLITSGIYSVTSATSNGPVSTTGIVTVALNVSGNAVMQDYMSLAGGSNLGSRRWTRSGTISGGVATWHAWTQTTLRPNELASPVDANSLVESGIYQASGLSNGPAAVGAAQCHIEVISNGSLTIITQILHEITGNTHWVRSLTSGVWSAWKQVMTGDLFASAINQGNGYQKLPGGMILQFGGGTTNSNGQLDITLPIAFSGTTFRVVACAKGSTADNASVSTRTNHAQGVSVFSTKSASGSPPAAGALAIEWFAIGF